MKVFMLEDNPEIFKVIKLLNETKKCKILHATNLKDAAYLLEAEPGVKHFDKFIFDVRLLSEKVPHLLSKEFVTYNEPHEFNGLLFLLNNIKLFGEITPEKIAIITAHKVKDVKEFITPNEQRFVKSELPEEEKKLLRDHGHLERIRYLDGERNYYTFSYIDKTKENKDLKMIEDFIFDRRPVQTNK